MERPFVSKFKGLITLSYSTKYDMWKFDFTSQFNGAVRLPDTKSNPTEFQREDYSEEYTMLFAQITRKFKHFDVYLGCENILDFMQHHPIVDAQNPFSQNFDASMIWGAISGRMFYAGFRLAIK
jgi:outer membrane receptor for ferrienterochelin and colicins